MARTFRGGVRPKGARTVASTKTIKDVALPPRVVLPLSQHTGTPAKPLVKAGDAVRWGTMIAEADGFISVPVHASISGRVTAIRDFPHPAGRMMPAIEIEGDGKDDAVDDALWQDLAAAEPEAIRRAVRDAGIVGLGGAGFPTHVKLSPPAGVKIDTVILNGAECEPGLTSDHRLMVDEAGAIVDGLVIMMRAVGATRGYVGIERDKPDALAEIKAAARSLAGIRVTGLGVKYPQGAEKMLIKVVIRREVPRGGLPMDVGCVVQNVATSFALAQAVRHGKPLTSRVVTLAGSAARAPGVFRVRLGTPVGHLIAVSGGASDDCARIVLGGPMTGVAQSTVDVPIIKATTGIILMRARDVRARSAGPCIRCGRCVERCPMGLMPNDLARFAERGWVDSAASYGVLDCIECGVCSYVCPAKIDLVHWMRLGKAAVTAAGQAGDSA